MLSEKQVTDAVEAFARTVRGHEITKLGDYEWRVRRLVAAPVGFAALAADGAVVQIHRRCVSEKEAKDYVMALAMRSAIEAAISEFVLSPRPA